MRFHAEILKFNNTHRIGRPAPKTNTSTPQTHQQPCALTRNHPVWQKNSERIHRCNRDGSIYGQRRDVPEPVAIAPLPAGSGEVSDNHNRLFLASRYH